MHTEGRGLQRTKLIHSEKQYTSIVWQARVCVRVCVRVRVRVRVCMLVRDWHFIASVSAAQRVQVERLQNCAVQLVAQHVRWRAPFVSMAQHVTFLLHSGLLKAQR